MPIRRERLARARYFYAELMYVLHMAYLNLVPVSAHGTRDCNSDSCGSDAMFLSSHNCAITGTALECETRELSTVFTFDRYLAQALKKAKLFELGKIKRRLAQAGTPENTAKLQLQLTAAKSADVLRLTNVLAERCNWAARLRDDSRPNPESASGVHDALKQDDGNPSSTECESSKIACLQESRVDQWDDLPTEEDPPQIPESAEQGPPSSPLPDANVDVTCASTVDPIITEETVCLSQFSDEAPQSVLDAPDTGVAEVQVKTAEQQEPAQSTAGIEACSSSEHADAIVRKRLLSAACVMSEVKAATAFILDFAKRHGVQAPTPHMPAAAPSSTNQRHGIEPDPHVKNASGSGDDHTDAHKNGLKSADNSVDEHEREVDVEVLDDKCTNTRQESDPGSDAEPLRQESEDGTGDEDLGREFGTMLADSESDGEPAEMPSCVLELLQKQPPTVPGEHSSTSVFVQADILGRPQYIS